MNYEEYLAYLDTLEGIARLPYTAVVTNPPDKLAEYRRPFTREEWEKWQGFAQEAEARMQL